MHPKTLDMLLSPNLDLYLLKWILLRPNPKHVGIDSKPTINLHQARFAPFSGPMCKQTSGAAIALLHCTTEWQHISDVCLSQVLRPGLPGSPLGAGGLDQAPPAPPHAHQCPAHRRRHGGGDSRLQGASPATSSWAPSPATPAHSPSGAPHSLLNCTHPPTPCFRIPAHVYNYMIDIYYIWNIYERYIYIRWIYREVRDFFLLPVLHIYLVSPSVLVWTTLLEGWHYPLHLGWEGRQHHLLSKLTTTRLFSPSLSLAQALPISQS